MVEVKFVEIRDRATFIPAIAMRFSGADHYLARRAGYSQHFPYVMLTKLDGVEAHVDPYEGWRSRTMQSAHLWLTEHWDEHVDGAVLDVEFIRGESTAPKLSESITAPY